MLEVFILERKKATSVHHLRIKNASEEKSQYLQAIATL